MTSTVDTICKLLTQPCWWYHPPGAQPCLSSGFGTCTEQSAIICQECTIADNVSSRTEDCTFLVVVPRWLGDHDCTAQYNCCLPIAADCRHFCLLFNFVRCPWRDSVTLISTSLVTYLLCMPLMLQTERMLKIQLLLNATAICQST